MAKPFVAVAEFEAPGNLSLPGWTIGVAVVSAMLMAAGGIIALVRPEMLVSSGAAISDGVRIYAGYLVSRNIAVAAFLLITLALKARRALANFMFLAGVIQVFDATLDCFEGRWPLAPGIVLIGAALFMAASRVSGQPFWKRSFWLD